MARHGGRTAGVDELERRESDSLLVSPIQNLILKHPRIWEKKYGRGTKYIIKQREVEAEKKRIKEEK